jgi:hypothetical protein
MTRVWCFLATAPLLGPSTALAVVPPTDQAARDMFDRSGFVHRDAPLTELPPGEKVDPRHALLELQIVEPVSRLSVLSLDGVWLWSTRAPKIGELHRFDVAPSSYRVQQRSQDGSSKPPFMVQEQREIALRAGETHRVSTWRRGQPTLDPRIGPAQVPNKPGVFTEVLCIYVRAEGYDLFWKGHEQRVSREAIEAALLALPLEAWPYGRAVGLSHGGLATEEDQRRMDANEAYLLPLLERLGVEVTRLPT